MPQQEAQSNSGSPWTNFLWRMLMMYVIYSYFIAKPAQKTSPNGDPLPPHSNIISEGQLLQLKVYFSNQPSAQDFNVNDAVLLWSEENIRYNWDEANNRNKTITMPTPTTLKENGTMYYHILFTTGFYEDSDVIISAVHPANKFMKMKKPDSRKNLIYSESNDDQLNNNEHFDKEETIVSHWYIQFFFLQYMMVLSRNPNLTLHLIMDNTRYPNGGIPPQLLEDMKFDEKGINYYPVLFIDEFWTFKDDYIPLNDTVEHLTLSLSYSPMSLVKWQMMMQMEKSFQMQVALGTALENESDDFKRMLIETNPYLLGLTVLVTLLHTIFDFLAFKNDISFWKNKKSFEGMSIRTMLLNTVCQIIIFLYLLDNDTSWMIIISAGIGLLIEFWKINKAINIEVDWNRRFPIVLKDKESYVKSKTKEYDDQAMKYLSYILYPLIFGYSVYSLLYDTHKSWYSWVLSSLTGCVYTFGFIMMCPQLFINYKLKSVAHLPWRAFAYKALNTFIDDLFAFIIKMPTMHRLSCFRDDIVFLIYLYQRWIYRVDYTRVNEFGQGGEVEQEGEETVQNGTAIEQSDKKND